MTIASATGVRGNFSEVLGRVAYGKERVTIERRGRPVAALVPIEDLKRLENGAGDGPDAAGELLRALGENLPGSLYRRILHPDGRTTYDYISSSLLETFGLDPKAALERPEMLVDVIHPEDRERRHQAYAESARNLAPYNNEYRCVTPQGEIRWLHSISRPRRCNDGVIIWTGITLEITERKRAEAALEKARDELERRVEERTRELHATNRALEEEVGTRKAVEERLREGERDLLNLIEGSIQGVLIITRERKPLFANRACAEIFGYQSPAEILSLENTLSLVDPSALERLDAIGVTQFAQDEAPTFYELDGLRKDGATVRLQCMARAMDWKGERVAQITLFDITERKRAEAALRDSRELLQAVVDAVPAMVNAKDLESRYVFMNRFQAEVYGVDPEQAVGQTADQLVSAEHGAYTRNLDRRVIESGAALPYFEETVEIGQSPPRHWLTTKVPLLDENNRVRNIVTVALDINERKKAEEAVRTRDSWLRGILENAPLQIVLKDTEGQIMAISRNTGEMLGTSMDAFPGRTTADFLPEDVAEIYMATDREVVATGRAIQQEVVEDWDGTTRHFLSSKFPLRDDVGKIVGVCSLTSDITEAKLDEERLRQAQKMEAVGQLTGGVAHDFNNLLAVIVGNADLLGERLGAEDRQVAAVLRAAGRGAELTQRLLAFSRRQPLKPRAVDLVAQVAGMTELLTRTLGATIEISVSSMPGLWRASADPGQLENALLNLAINARDAMPEGGRLSIATANASLDRAAIAAVERGGELSGVAPGDYVVLAVADNGIGMSPEVLVHVFEPFFTTKDVGEGSGLGLSMVYGFARQSGGFAAIESEESRGATVRLYLPRAEAEAVRPGDRASAPAAPRGRGETVLVVEDARDVRELAVAMLEDLGYRVLAATDAAEADALFAGHPEVELLLTDVILPGGRSGPDFAETAHRENPELKILFMSGYPAGTSMQLGDDLGQDVTLIAKPFRKAELARAVREVLDRRDRVRSHRDDGRIEF